MAQIRKLGGVWDFVEDAWGFLSKYTPAGWVASGLLVWTKLYWTTLISLLKNPDAVVAALFDAANKFVGGPVGGLIMAGKTWLEAHGGLTTTAKVVVFNNTLAPVALYLVNDTSNTQVVALAPSSALFQTPASVAGPDTVVALPEGASVAEIPASLWAAFLGSDKGMFALDIGASTGPGGAKFQGGQYALGNYDVMHPVLVGPNTIASVLQPLQGGLGFTYQLTMTVFAAEGTSLDNATVFMTLSIREDRASIIHLTPALAKLNQPGPSRPSPTVTIRFEATATNSVTQVVIPTPVPGPGTPAPTVWACLPEGTNLVTYRSLCVGPDQCNAVMSGTPQPQESAALTGDHGSVYMLTRVLAVTTPDTPSAFQCEAMARFPSCVGVCAGSSAVATIQFSDAAPVLGAVYRRPLSLPSSLSSLPVPNHLVYKLVKTVDSLQTQVHKFVGVNVAALVVGIVALVVLLVVVVLAALMSAKIL
jgi:hypothetical protein